MKKLKRLKLYDIFTPFIFMLCVPIALVYSRILKATGRKITLICEDPNEACDNGFVFFEYLKAKDVDDVYYAITKNSPHRYKFEGYEDSVVTFYSIKHWIYYLTAENNISIHKASSPAPALFYVLQKYKLFDGNRTFLQHGVTMNNVDYLHKKECNFKYFLTAAIPEYNFILDNFGYDETEVKLLGFPRYDKLYNCLQTREKIIAVMPTWRSYLCDLSNEEFKSSDFYKNWMDLLLDKKLNNLLKENDLTLIFYLHRNFQKFNDLFYSFDNIKVLSSSNIDIQYLINVASCLITDYSSISIDFAYSNRPIIYYQFDYPEFRDKHLSEGYFSYRDDGFGKIFLNTDGMVAEIEKLISNSFKVDDKFKERTKSFFGYIDDKNSERVYKLLFRDKKGK